MPADRSLTCERRPVSGMLGALVVLAISVGPGCALIPEIAHQPSLHNPFPQLSKVAIVDFFNQSNEATVDGRQFAMAYFNELQLVPGFEVIPVDVTAKAMADNQITLTGPGDARRLAQVLGADAVVIGTVTDYSPYYPPRCGMQVHWYAANPCFHPIPPGYGLPWGTPDEEQIPDTVVLEAEMALAKAQMDTQTPAPPVLESPPLASPKSKEPESPLDGGVKQSSFETPIEAPAGVASQTCVPDGWPDPRGFVPKPPQCERPLCQPASGAVLEHTRTYNGNDPDFTEALENYWFFRDDARFGGWQDYLSRSDDFIRFCCRMHIWEMFSARGGAGKTRVVLRWHENR